MMRLRSATGGALLALVLLASACGRGPVAHNPEDGGMIPDGTSNDFTSDFGRTDGPKTDGPKTDGPKPCVPDCTKICDLQRDCGIIQPSKHATCVSDCQAHPTDTVNVCLGQLVCLPSPSCGDANKCVTDPKAPDLTVTHSAMPGGKGELSYEAKVCNVGNGPAGVTSVHFYRNRSSSPKAGEAGDRVASVPALSAGACTSVKTVDAGLKSGTYTTWTQVDVNKQVVEQREDNNVSGPVTAKVTGGVTQWPDLVVSALTAKVDTSAGTATYTAAVCNLGAAASSKTSVDFYANRKSAPIAGQAGDASVAVSGLSVNGCANVQWTTKLTSGTYTSWAQVDRPNMVSESNEKNNVYGPVTFTVGGTPLPDLQVTSLSIKPSSSGATMFTAKVCNIGKATVPGTADLWIYIDRTTAPGPTVPADRRTTLKGPINPGACRTYSWSTTLKAGTYRGWALVDGSNAIKESNESNNTTGPVVYTVGSPAQPDLVVDTLTVSASSSGAVSYMATVCNRGAAAASGGIYLWYYYNRSTQPSGSNPSDYKANLGSSLAAGACTKSSWNAKIKAGKYQAWALVDGGNMVKESNEYNNIKGPVAYTVASAGQPDLVVSSLAVQSTTSGTARYTAKVCNNGSVATTVAPWIWLYAHSASKPGPGTATHDNNTVGSVLAAGACKSATFNLNRSPGSYSAWALVDGSNVISESNENNNMAGPIKYTVSSTPQADLTVSLTTNVGTGGAVTYSAKVCNAGTAATTVATYLRLYTNLNSTPTWSTKHDKGILVAHTMAPGACKTVTWKTTKNPGSYKAWALVDPVNYIKESNESNNTAGPVSYTVTGAVKKPDLKVEGLTASVTATGIATYRVQVCNRGTAAVASGTTHMVGVYINRSSAPSTSNTASKLVAISVLAVNACVSKTTSVQLKVGSFSSWALADATGKVAESNEGNNYRGPLKVTYQPSTPMPDLRVTGLKYVASSGPTGRGQYQVTMCNYGKATASGARADVYYNRSSAPTTSTAGNLSVYIGTLTAGACNTRYGYVTLSPGTYRSWAYADRGQAIQESDETNNVYGPQTVNVAGSGKPDLQVINVSVSQSGSYTYYYITVCNRGTAQSVNSTLDLYYNRSSAPPVSLAGNQQSSLSQLNAGACTTRNLYANLPGGSYSSWIRLDRANAVNESNESNNVHGPVTFKVAGSGKPDLQITSVKAAPYGTSYGYTLYDVTVCNRGTATAGSARVELYYDRASKPTANDAGQRYTSTSTLAAGACTNRRIYATLSPGTYHSWLWVDRTNAVLESNENNNIYGPMTVKVAPPSQPDLVVSSLKVSSSSSGATTYQAQVCNRGKGPSTGAYLDIYYHRTTKPSTSDAGAGTAYIAALNPGSCTTVTHSVALPNGSYTSWAQVDRRQRVAESNENNNVYGPVTVNVGANASKCALVCNTLVSPCRLISSSQYTTCVAGCVGQTQTKIDCAYKAAQSKNCGGIIGCLSR